MKACGRATANFPYTLRYIRKVKLFGLLRVPLPCLELRKRSCTSDLCRTRTRVCAVPADTGDSHSRTGNAITWGAKLAVGVVGTRTEEPKPGLRGLNLDVLQALFRKGTHRPGQCTNHNLEQVLDPKQLPCSYKKLKHT